MSTVLSLQIVFLLHAISKTAMSFLILIVIFSQTKPFDAVSSATNVFFLDCESSFYRLYSVMVKIDGKAIESGSISKQLKIAFVDIHPP